MSRENRILIPLTHSRGSIRVWANPPHALFKHYWQLVESFRELQSVDVGNDQQRVKLYDDLVTTFMQAEYSVLSAVWFKGQQALPMTKKQVETLAELLGNEFGELIWQTWCMIEAHYARMN